MSSNRLYKSRPRPRKESKGKNMSKKEGLNSLKSRLYKELFDLMEVEREIEIVEKEIYKEKDKESTRRGMLEALTEDFFSELIKIAEDEEEMENEE
jgi:hypothetical protein